MGRVSLLVAEDLADQERALFVTRSDSDEVILQRLELAVAQHADADTSRLRVMLRLLKLARQADVQAETAVFDRWFYVTDFIAQVLVLGFARVVTKVKRDIPYRTPITARPTRLTNCGGSSRLNASAASAYEVSGSSWLRCRSGKRAWVTSSWSW